MNHLFSRVVLLAASLVLSAAAVPTPATAPQSPARPSTSASSVTTQSVDRGAGRTTVLALAQRCIDPRHVALVSNALRRGRVFTLAEARGWCAHRSPRSTACAAAMADRPSALGRRQQQPT
jgi:hypothetical protein